MATGRIGVTPTLGTRWSKAPSAGTTSLSGLDDNSVSLVYSVGYEAVYRNGVLLSRTNDYTATDGTTVTLIDATIAGDIIEIFANQLVPLTDAISKGQFTAKAALLSATAASTPAVLTVGANDTVLTADSTTATGLKWATPAAGGMTSIASGSLSGANVNLTSITQTYKDLRLVIKSPQQSSDEDFYIRPNNDSTGPYAVIGGTSLSATMVVSTNRTNVSATDVLGNSLMESSVTDNLVIYDFPDYATATTNHIIQMRNAYTNDAAVNVAGFSTTNYCPATPVAITSINIISDAGSWTGGTYILYGVS